MSLRSVNIDDRAKKPKTFRDARHLNKYLYTLTNELFYEPIEDRYRSSNEYVDLVNAVVRERAWTVAREGFWFHAHPPAHHLPLQGWKIHISATLNNSANILCRAAHIALRNGVAFKFALDRNILSLIGFKGWARGGSGKFITMYPVDTQHFEDLLAQLYDELRHEEGPYILSDKRYRDCRVLFYRYGGILPNTSLSLTGEMVPQLRTPGIESVPDARLPFFAPPRWAPSPFQAEDKRPCVMALKSGRYHIIRPLSFSNSGGIYLAEDTHAGVRVIVKEARPHTVCEINGNDAITRLRKEFDILTLLDGANIAPRPIDLFQEWEHLYLVQEFIDGLAPRRIMISESPLLRINPSLQDGEHYHQHFTAMFSSLVRAISLLHERGIVFGDLSHTNIIVDPGEYSVRLIDFECSVREGIDNPTAAFTPGYRSTDGIRRASPQREDDLYAVAAIMLYMLFPVAALSALRTDLFESVLQMLLTDVGWSHTEMFSIIRGLSRNELSCRQVSERLSNPASLAPPAYGESQTTHRCAEVVSQLAQFVLTHMHPDNAEALFPADPFMYRTNPLSLGFGACGVLHALVKCGVDIPKAAHGWLEQRLDAREAVAQLPPGLLTGSAGIAWCLWDLGYEDRARELLCAANNSPLLKEHHSYLYGMAGVGLANLYFYLHTQDSRYLSMAADLATTLIVSAREDAKGMYWEADNTISLGLGYGQSGVALFLLRLFQLSGNRDHLTVARKALVFDLSHGVEMEAGALSFPNTPSDTALLPYLEEGAAGIAKVLLRFGAWEKSNLLLSETHRKYSGFPGLLYGLGSFVDVLTDAYVFSRDERFIDMAKRPISGLLDLYLLRRQDGVAIPGDGLFRVSCDYATGIAGVMRALHRYVYRDKADFFLDELTVNHASFPSVRDITPDTERQGDVFGDVFPAIEMADKVFARIVV